MDPEHEQLAQLIRGMSDRLHRELESIGREMHEGFKHFDATQTRLDRHGALLQTGARWSARMTQWSEDVDQRREQQD